MRTNNVLYDVTRKFAFFLVVLVTAFGCSDDDGEEKNEKAGTSEVTLNGGRYSNLTAKTTTPAIGGFEPSQNMTAITYTAEVGDESFLVVIAYPGQGTGQESWEEETCFVSVMQYLDDDHENGVTSTYLKEDGGIHSGFVKIDNYGPVGSVISGSFEGSVSFIDSECNCTQEGSIKGKFSAERLY